LACPAKNSGNLGSVQLTVNNRRKPPDFSLPVLLSCNYSLFVTGSTVEHAMDHEKIANDEGTQRLGNNRLPILKV
jgi:hypothetical protein